jgi:preprotein translocase subunit SecA
MLKKVFGTRNERELKRMGKVVRRINALEESLQALDDVALAAKTNEFRARLADGEALDSLLPEAFAVAREAGRRTLGMRHFDVQLIGGMALHEGKIAEMRTGEGKTLVATLPAYLNALTGAPVHMVTVNDYLAGRDAQWMGPLYEFLGLRVGVIRSGQSQQEKRDAYTADVIYGTNNEFGFDYLRDNMAFSLEEKLQGSLSFAIVDEVDSILIDEARTPLIISGAAQDSSELYKRINKLVPQLQRQPEEGEEGDEEGHFSVDEKMRQVELSEAGHEFVEQLLVREGLLEEGESLYASTNLSLLHHVHTALRAHAMFQRDVEYIVQGGQVVLIDEHTGRTMPGRRLVRGPAPGDRGQGGRGDPEREPDPGLDHLPELFPPLRQARRHDRHGGYGGLRVPPDLRSRGRGDSHQQADGTPGPERPCLTCRARRSSTPSSPMCRPVSTAVRRRWSVPRPWRPPRSCPRASAGTRFPTRC